MKEDFVLPEQTASLGLFFIPSLQVNSGLHPRPKARSLLAAMIAITLFRKIWISPLGGFFLFLDLLGFPSRERTWTTVLISFLKYSHALICSLRKSFCTDNSQDLLYNGYIAPAIRAQAASKATCSFCFWDNNFFVNDSSSVNWSLTFPRLETFSLASSAPRWHDWKIMKLSQSQFLFYIILAITKLRSSCNRNVQCITVNKNKVVKVPNKSDSVCEERKRFSHK